MSLSPVQGLSAGASTLAAVLKDLGPVAQEPATAAAVEELKLLLSQNR